MTRKWIEKTGDRLAGLGGRFMSVVYDLEHTTVYRYRQAVRFGQHRVTF
ncbi:MAG: hypothetical protein Q6J44_08735 [Gloeomargarita sp. DG02_4_bins_56]